MERLRHRVTGVAVSVDADTAGRLGTDWVPADVEPQKQAPVKRSPKPAK